MANSLLRIENLKAWLHTGKGVVHAVDGVDLEVRRGETSALLGESGCGKSMTALAIMRLLPSAGRIIQGSVLLGDQDLLALPETAMRKVRGGRLAMIFQEPQTSLNPVLAVGIQIGEALSLHQGLKGRAARERVLELLEAVGIPDPERRVHEFPHQLSGGMKQRVMIAIALAGEPDLLIADEPTTALDVTIQAQVLALLKDLQARTGMGILLITHDLGVVAEVADRVAVMYAGHIVEEGTCARFFKEAAHPYSHKLFASLPNAAKRQTTLEVIRGTVPSLVQSFAGCRFEPRCELAWDKCRDQVPPWSRFEDGHRVRCHLYTSEGRSGLDVAVPATEPLERQHPRAHDRDDTVLRVDELKVHFPIQKGVLKHTVGYVRAVDGISMKFQAGRTVALVGESGCGKTTVGKSILQLLRPTSGSVRFNGEELTKLPRKVLRRRRRELQIVFQDPYSSMNPRMMVADIVEEGMITQGIGGDRDSRQRRVDDLLKQVGLDPDAKRRYPHEFSGGQRQRICIARALAVNPKLIVCDEPTSALDVSVQAQILNLLKELQTNLGLTYLFITHDLSVVEYMAHTVAVMYLGRIVERGTLEELIEKPKHPYTQALLSAVPVIEPETKREVIRLKGELPSPVNPPQGCHFHPRCPYVLPECRLDYPALVDFSGTHSAHCCLYRSERAIASSEPADLVE